MSDHLWSAIFSVIVYWFWENYATFPVMQVSLNPSKTEPNIGIDFLSTQPKLISTPPKSIRLLYFVFVWSQIGFGKIIPLSKSSKLVSVQAKTEPKIGIHFLSTQPKLISIQPKLILIQPWVNHIYLRFRLCSFGVKSKQWHPAALTK